MNVNGIELSIRGTNCLNNADITIISELVMKGENTMLKYRNFDERSGIEINDKSEELNSSLGMRVDEHILSY
jgi:DNA-directed RNA polymerase subunit alpha